MHEGSSLARLAVLSDVHGCLPALQAVLADLDRLGGADRLIVAGDYVGAPHPVEALRLLRERQAWMILGNSDAGQLRYDAGQAPAFLRTSHQFALLRWSHQHIERETLDFLRSLPGEGVFQLPGTAPICVVHVPPEKLDASIYPRVLPAGVEEALEAIAEPVLVFGHSHQSFALPWNGRLVLNPGAVTGPLNGFVGAQYALLTWRQDHWEPELRGVRYDRALVRQEFQESGLLGEGGPLARCFLLSIESAHNVAEDYLAYARLVARQLGLAAADHIPDEAWDRAAETYDWESAAVGQLRYYVE